MNFMHKEFDAGPGDIVEVSVDKQANVMLLDAANFELYKQGQKFQYHGGRATKSPIQIVPPHQARWHIVVDLGGYAGTVKVGVQIVQGVNS